MVEFCGLGRGADADTPNSQAALIQSFFGGFLDGIHNQKQIGIECAPDLLAGFAGAVVSLPGANRADIAANGVEVLLDIVAADRLDGLGYLGKQMEQGATGGLFQAALGVYGTFGTNAADPIANQNLDFR
jgi:hypothetical protein